MRRRDLSARPVQHRKGSKPSELAEEAINRIEKLNPQLNAVIHKRLTMVCGRAFPVHPPAPAQRPANRPVFRRLCLKKKTEAPRCGKEPGRCEHPGPLLTVSQGNPNIWVMAFFLHSPFLALFSFVWVPIFFAACLAEEKDLTLRYDEAYKTYRRRTGFLTPKWKTR